MFLQPPGFDLELFLLINQQWRLPLFDTVMPILSSMGVLFAVMGAALVFAVVKGGKRQIILFLVLLAGMGISDFTTNVIKKQAQRVRPLNAIAGTYYQEGNQWQTRPADFVQTKEKGTSFPSAHSSNTMCLAVLMTLLWPALRKWPLVLPILVGYSRIYLGKHYPIDVLAGWIVGLALAGVIWFVWKNLERRFLPEMKN